MINRRTFIKYMGLGTAGVLTSCSASEENTDIAAGSGEMSTRVNHNSGDKVSILGYGCMRFPALEKPAEDGNILDQEAVNQLVDYAIEHGVNFFDTAPVYSQGWSEVAVGNALSRHPRSSYFVSTKLSNMPEPTLENSIRMYHSSMEKLKVDYLDYYLLHSIGGGRDCFELFNRRFIDNGLLDYLLEERKAGRIRNLGFSFHGDVRLFDHMMSRHDEIHWDFVLIQMNYADWKHASGRNVNAEYLYGELAKRDIPVIVMEPLLGGRLSKLPDHLVSRLVRRNPEGSVASWAFRFAGSFPKVLTVLSGMSCMEHLQDNLKTYSPLAPLSDDDNAFLEDIAAMMLKYPTIPCNDCKYCMPCPYGLDIPAILTHYNKCVNEGNFAHNTSDENYSSARRAFLIGYDRSVPKLRQADHCTGCGECIDECPQKIDIPVQLRKIDRYVHTIRQGFVSLMDLKDTLHDGNHSLVLCSGGAAFRTFDGIGVSDIYKLYTEEPETLKGAVLADKVIGKGAALFMILGGVKEVYADLISMPALELLKQNNIRALYDKRTDEIMNHDKSDICPVEKICKDESDLQKCVPLIGEFLKSKGLV